MDTSIITTGIGAAATILVGFLTYLGVRRQASAAKAGAAQQTAQVQADTAVQAWQELLEPYRAEVALVRGELATLRADHDAELIRLGEEHRAELLAFRVELKTLTDQVTRWKRLARANARVAMKLWDLLVAAGIDVPEMADDLVLVQETLEGDDT